MVSRICLSSTRRSVTTMTESKTACRLLQPDELVRQPGDGVALAAAGRVLDQVPLLPDARGGVGQQLAHHVELVVAGEDLLRFFCRSSRPFSSTTWA
jgi:hypothetical protein